MLNSKEKTDFLNSYYIKNFIIRELNKIIIFFAILFGSLVMFFPIQNLIFFIIGLMLFIFLLLNPEICFYLTIITQVFTDTFSFGGQDFPFNQTNILLSILMLSLGIKYFLSYEKVSLKTPIDIWFLIIGIVYFYAGFLTTITHRGYQGFVMYIQLVALFYITVYFIRTNSISIKNLLKVLLGVCLFESVLGIFQSFTGIGTTYLSNRNILGYIGIGSKRVFHGHGTFDHFNNFGMYISFFTVYFMSYYKLIERKKIFKIIAALLVTAVYISYSRNSLFFFLVLFAVFVAFNQKDKFKSFLSLSLFGGFLFIVFTFLQHTSYISTISPRNDLWITTLDAINMHDSLLFGVGLKSVYELLKIYIPFGQSPRDWLPHSYYLYVMVETGIVGFSVWMSFFFTNLILLIKRFFSEYGIKETFSSAVFAILFVFGIGIVDMFFNFFKGQFYLFIILGIAYAGYYTKNSELKIQ